MVAVAVALVSVLGDTLTGGDARAGIPRRYRLQPQPKERYL